MCDLTLDCSAFQIFSPVSDISSCRTLEQARPAPPSCRPAKAAVRSRLRSIKGKEIGRGVREVGALDTARGYSFRKMTKYYLLIYLIMNVTLRQIQAFLAVADLGNFTRAAARLNMAQPALSLTIRELEAELGLRLFDRTTRRVELTKAGADFSHAARKLMNDLDLAMRNARDLTERKRGRLVVAAPPLLAAMILPRAIADYKRTFPGIDVRLVDTQTDRIVDKVRSGEADCGVGTFAEDEDSIARQLAGQGRARGFLQQAIAAIEDAASRLARLVRSSPHHHDAGQLDPPVDRTRLSRRPALTFRPAFEVSLMTTAVMLVEAGLGVAILPTYVWSFARDRDVTSRPLVEPQMSREISMIHAAGRSLSPAAESFARFLRKHARHSLPRRGRARQFICQEHE